MFIDLQDIEHRASVMPEIFKKKVRTGEINTVLKKLGITLSRYPQCNKSLIAKAVHEIWDEMGIKCSLNKIKAALANLQEIEKQRK